MRVPKIHRAQERNQVGEMRIVAQEDQGSMGARHISMTNFHPCFRKTNVKIQEINKTNY